MPTQALILKVLYAASTVAGTMLVGLPAYAQISGSGTVIPPPNSPPVISVPGASPAYVANAAIAGTVGTQTDFTTWIAANGAVQISTDPVVPRPEGESVFVLYRFYVTDADGTADIKDAQVRLLRPDGSVHTDYAAAHSLGTSSAITKEYYAQFELKSTDVPATGTDFYKVAVKVADAAIQSGSLPYVDNAATPKLFQYGTLLLLKPSADVLDFGSLPVNGKSTGVPLTLTNLGNVALDSTLHATDLTDGGNTISAAKIWYGPTSAAAGTNFPDAAANAKRDAGFNLLPGASRIAYLAIEVPAGTPTGVYSTAITFTGAQHTGGACAADCATVSWS